MSISKPQTGKRRKLILDLLDFEGCWIEQHNFPGFPGCHDYPLFLRRLTSLGHVVGASLFPANEFNEQVFFVEITTAIALIDPIVGFVNDLFSFYKEFDEPRDQVILVRNYCHVEGISLEKALERLTEDIIHCYEQISVVFEGKDPNVIATVQGFVQGYLTWHLCAERYRFKEIYERCGKSSVETKFRHYCEQAWKVGYVDRGEWAIQPQLRDDEGSDISK